MPKTRKVSGGMSGCRTTAATARMRALVVSVDTMGGAAREQLRGALLRSVRGMILAGLLMCVAAGGLQSQAAHAAGTNGRADELVSPPDKNGGDVLLATARTRAAASDAAGDGDALSFASLAGFGDVGGMGIAADYIARRGDTGWVTHAITPVQEPSPAIFVFTGPGFPGYEGDLSPDLSKGVTRTYLSPTLPTTPNSRQVENLYVRKDLLTPGPGTYQLATDSVNPLVQNPSTYKPFFVGASSDFSHVVFESNMPLTADSPPDSQPRVYEAVNGVVHLVGVLPTALGGGVANQSVAGQGASLFLFANYTPHIVSRDGSRIFFTVPAAGDPSGTQQLYMRDDHGTAAPDDDTTSRISASEKAPTPDAPQGATYWDASADGRYVLFTTVEQLTNDDTNSATDLYRYDVDAPAGEHLSRLSIDHGPGDDPGDVAGVIGSSDDGSYVYFMASGQLVAGAPIPPNPSSPFAGVYLWHDGAIKYVGSLAPDDLDGVTEAIGREGWGGQKPKLARVSPDGHHLLFGSFEGAGLTGYDHGACAGTFTGTCREFYVYDADGGSLVCVSCNPSGAPATASATNYVERNQGAQPTTWHQNRALSDDGRFAFFTTAEALVREDRNTVEDAYEYDAVSHQVYLLSSGAADALASYYLEASPNGKDAFFATRDRLVGWDVDDGYDIYDARVNGGFAEPSVPSSCSGDACQGQGSGAPTFVGPGSAAFSGTGNVKPTVQKKHIKPATVRCHKGKVKRRVKGKVRCVAKKKRSATKHAKATSTRRVK